MHLAVWNVRRFNDPIRQVDGRKVLYKNKVSLMFFLETRVKIGTSSRVMKAVKSDWLWMHNYSKSSNGRIWITWNPSDVTVQVLLIDEQAIHCEVTSIADDVKFCCTVVYAHNTNLKREPLWRLLLQLHGQINSPWIVLGDFNTVLFHEERMRCRYLGVDTEELQNLIAQTGLFDLQFSGHALTWCNQQEGDRRLYCKLDRALVNTKWIDAFPMSGAVFMHPMSSDHSPCLVSITKTKFTPKPFRFCNLWTQDPNFMQLVTTSWEQQVSGCPMFRVVK